MSTPLNTGPFNTGPSNTDCPFDDRKITQHRTTPPHKAVERDIRGTYHIYGAEEARAILRAENNRQAGFFSEAFMRLPHLVRAPVIFTEGNAHYEMRTGTARFFTPSAVRSYEPWIAEIVHQLVSNLRHQEHIDLTKLTLEVSVAVAGRVIGLSDKPSGMAERLLAFFTNNGPGIGKLTPHSVADFLSYQIKLAKFYWFDVRPAIQRRRRNPQEDLITHLIGLGYRDADILVECLTYAAAGMITTREFMGVAIWQLLERPQLCERYLIATENERYAILGELLRLDPVIQCLYRRTTAPLDIAGTHLPSGSLIALHITDANVDGQIQEAPCEFRPDRTLPRGVPREVLSFGDGHHRCPGASIALSETDALLRELLAIKSRIKKIPQIKQNTMVQGYELANFVLELTPER